MTYTDVAGTDIANVRANIPDHLVDDSAHFTDEDLTVFLAQSGGDPVLAAAAALETWATTIAMGEHNVTLGDYREDTKGRSAALLARAKSLREGVASVPAFAIAQGHSGPGSPQWDTIVVNRALRGELG